MLRYILLLNIDIMKEYISTTEAAKKLGISRVAVFQKIKEGEIKAQKIGRNYAISPDEITSYQGYELSDSGKRIIDKAVDKTVKEYGETLRKLEHA